MLMWFVTAFVSRLRLVNLKDFVGKDFSFCALYFSSFWEMYTVLGVDLTIGLLIYCILLWEWHWRLQILSTFFFFSNPLISELIVECIRCYCANTMVSRFLSGSPISSLLIWLSHPRMPYIESALVWSYLSNSYIYCTLSPVWTYCIVWNWYWILELMICVL